jgi:predicted phosphodiesterase
MRIGLLGDLHGKTDAAIEWMERTEPDFCLQVGDYWSPCYDTEWPIETHWIFGNHERGEVARGLIDGTREQPPNNHWLEGGIVEIQGVTVMALPGLPAPGQGFGPASFPPNVYSLCWEQAQEHDVDVFISHGAPFPFWHFTWDPVANKRVRVNFEEPEITELVRRAAPTYAVSGHNHRFALEEFEGVQCIRLGMAPKSFTYMIEVP